MSKIFKNISYVCAIFALFLAVSCEQKQKTTAEIFAEEQSGVCLVLNACYYEIHLPTGKVWYCSGIDEDGDLKDLTLDEDEAKKNRSMLTGTAFFINKEGALLTNRHVASPMVTPEQLKQATKSLLSALRDLMEEGRSQLAQQYQELENQKSDYVAYDEYGNQYVDRSSLENIEEQQQELSDNFDELSATIQGVDNMDMNAIRIVPVSEIGIAYNNTFATKPEDFLDKNPCVLVRASKDEDVDLALIQLKDKKTPENAYVFSYIEEMKQQSVVDWAKETLGMTKKRKELTIGDQLSLIGYNAGPILAETKAGIKAQMTTGQVTQLSDGSRLLYSIPALQGSSGSPVVDADGKLVAVNFAKLSGTESFNFGIPLKQIRKFMGE